MLISSFAGPIQARSAYPSLSFSHKRRYRKGLAYIWGFVEADALVHDGSIKPAEVRQLRGSSPSVVTISGRAVKGTGWCSPDCREPIEKAPTTSRKSFTGNGSEFTRGTTPSMPAPSRTNGCATSISTWMSTRFYAPGTNPLPRPQSTKSPTCNPIPMNLFPSGPSTWVRPLRPWVRSINSRRHHHRRARATRTTTPWRQS